MTPALLFRCQKFLAVSALGVLLTAPEVRSQRLYGELFGPPARRPTVSTEAKVVYFESSETDDARKKLDFTSGEVDVAYRAPSKRGGEWQAGARGAYFNIETEARLPLSGAAIPGDLYDIEFRGGYRHPLDNGHMLGLSLRLGSPSDKPFNSYDETVIGATGLYRIPAGQRNSWNVFLDFATQRSFLSNIPLPGVAYAWVPNRETFALIGLPVAMYRTRFAERWGFELFYFPPIRGRAKLSYDITPGLTPYLSFKSYRDAFLRAGREDSDEWLRHEVLLGEVGVRWKLGKQISLDGAAGYAFDRYLYESDSFSDDDDRIDLEDGFALRLQVTSRI
jgi:hypothetical protein